MRDHKRWRVGVIDLLLVLALLLLAVGGLLRWQTLRELREAVADGAYHLVLTVEAIDTASAECLAEGEVLYDAAGRALGRVIALRREAAELCMSTDGGTVTGEWPQELRCRLVVRVAVEGSRREGVLTPTGWSPMPVGETVTLFSRRLRLCGRVSGVFSAADSENGIFNENV